MMEVNQFTIWVTALSFLFFFIFMRTFASIFSCQNCTKGTCISAFRTILKTFLSILCTIKFKPFLKLTFRQWVKIDNLCELYYKYKYIIQNKYFINIVCVTVQSFHIHISIHNFFRRPFIFYTNSFISYFPYSQ